MTLPIPESLAISCRSSAVRRAWRDRLADVVPALARRWSLRLAAPFDGRDVSCSWVAAATRPDGSAAVLKVGMPHMEGEQEIDGLRFWDGEPTVRLLDADGALGAMLLERCEPAESLHTRPDAEQDSVIASLLQRLWHPPPPGIRPLSVLLDFWRDETMASATDWADAALVTDGLTLFRTLSASAPSAVLLATDLHAGNVLRARREPWLVIDPKPFAGDPAYDATQHLLNCPERVRAEPQRTIGAFADRVGVDRERVRLWLFARLAAAPRDDWRDERWLSLARILAP